MADSPRPRARHEPTGAGVVPFAVGLWLLAAPWVLGFESEGAAWNAIACGFAIAFLAFLRASGDLDSSLPGLSVLAVGAWLLLSSVLLDSSLAAALNAVLCGGVVVVLAVWAQTSARAARRSGQAAGTRA